LTHRKNAAIHPNRGFAAFPRGDPVAMMIFFATVSIAVAISVVRRIGKL
jgi:hypothetical protein